MMCGDKAAAADADVAEDVLLIRCGEEEVRETEEGLVLSELVP
jgi:hypothetical protein